MVKKLSSGYCERRGVNFKNGKKPVNLIKDIIKMFPNNKNATILDFAGSGTTGQAVVELNSEDKGNRNFILITNEDQDTVRS